MSHKLPVNGFKWVKQKKNYQNLMKTSQKSMMNIVKLSCNKEDKEKYVIHIRALKEALNHGLKPKETHRVI